MFLQLMFSEEEGYYFGILSEEIAKRMITNGFKWCVLSISYDANTNQKESKICVVWSCYSSTLWYNDPSYILVKYCEYISSITGIDIIYLMKKINIIPYEEGKKIIGL